MTATTKSSTTTVNRAGFGIDGNLLMLLIGSIGRPLETPVGGKGLRAGSPKLCFHESAKPPQRKGLLASLAR
jgi:hypothetical protein